LQTLETAVAQGASFSQLARDLTAYFRDLMLLSVGFAGELGLSEPETAMRQHHVQLLGRARLEATLSALREASKEMRENVDHRLIVELTLVRAGQNSFAAPTFAPVAAPAAPGLRPVAAQTAPVPAWKQIKPAVATPIPVPPVSPDVPPEAREAQELAADAYPTVADEQDFAPEIRPTAPEAQESTAEKVAALPEPVSTPPEPEISPEPPAPRKKGRRIANFEDLVELWPAVLMRIRKKIGVTAVAYLHDAQPVGFTNDDVILEFVKEFHHAKACDASDRLGFEKIINETLDKPRRLKLQLAVPAPKKVEVVEDVVEEDNDEFDGEAAENIIDYAQSVFGADIVGRSG
jgi:hypothetical protein